MQLQASNSTDLPPSGEVCPRCGKPEFDPASYVEQLRRRIAALEADNAALMASATAFADLADRLNRRLRNEMRTG